MIKHAILARTVLRWCLVAVSLGGLQVAQAAPGASEIGVSRSGSTWTFSNVSPGSGAFLASGSFQPDGVLAVKKPVTLPLGTGVGVEVSTKFTRESFAKALVAAAVVSGSPVLATAAIGAMVGYGLSNVGVQGGVLSAESPDAPAGVVVSDGFEYTAHNNFSVGAYPTAELACLARAAELNAMFGQPGRFTYSSSSTSPLSCRISDSGGAPASVGISLRASSCPAGWYVGPQGCSAAMEPEILTGQALSDWIANRTGWPDSSAIALGRMLGAPQAARHLEPTGGVTVTGPSSVPGEKSTTSESVDLVPGTNTPAAPGSTNTEPGTKETTKEKTIELDYDGGQVKGTEKVTTITNITNNVTNITTTESSEQSTEDAEKSDFCKDNPGSLACAEMDTPEGEIPRSTFDVGYEIEDSWGGGACPADVYTTINGESVMVWDWVTSCGYIHTYVRPVLLALCAFGALMIIMPGRAEA